MTNTIPKLYLLPVPLGEDCLHTIPEYVIDIIHSLDVFVVERAKTARHFLKSIGFPKPFDDCIFFELNKRTEDTEIPGFLHPTRDGRSVGLLSEAGVPAVADPGSKLVHQAHRQGVVVAPLVGPSSLLLALMGSGLNGQSFTFHGYLSPKRSEIARELRRLEGRVTKNKETQLFIETPYRNNSVFEAALQYLNGSTLFTVAMDLTLPTEYIKTMKINQWKEVTAPDMHKRPVVFLLGKPGR